MNFSLYNLVLIPFIIGFSNFGGKATVLSIDIVGGTSEYTLVDLTFELTNPSNITITIGDINFDVIFNEQNVVVGRVYVKDAIIPPGAKTFTAQMHLGEKTTNSKAIGQIFSNYLTSAVTPLTIVGSEESTKIAPLVPALSSVKLASEMKGIQANLVKQIAVKGSLIGLTILNKAESVITLQNPLSTAYSIKAVKASVVFKPSSGAAPFTVGTIDYKLPSDVSVSSKGTAETGEWPVAIVGRGLEHLGQLIGLLLDPNKYFDVQQNVTVSVGDGYVTEMFYYQDKVPFTISIDGLPPIGITADSLSSASLPASLTSISDPNQFEQALKDFLSGKKPESSSAIPGATSETALTPTSEAATATTTSAAKEEKPTATEEKPTATEQAPTAKETTPSAETTTSGPPRFELPF
jgi:hypothetical protein